MIKSSLYALFIVMLSIPAWAENSVTEWKIIPEESAIIFTATQMGAEFDGVFNRFDGNILFDPANPSTGRALIEIDTGSIDANSTDRNKYLPMPDWFNVAVFPTARFETTGFENGLGNNQYVARGNLTIRDRTNPVTLPFTLTVNDDGKAHVTGETKVNRLDFGVGQGQWADVKTVSAEVTVKISLTAVPVTAR